MEITLTDLSALLKPEHRAKGYKLIECEDVLQLHIPNSDETVEFPATKARIEQVDAVIEKYEGGGDKCTMNSPAC